MRGNAGMKKCSTAVTLTLLSSLVLAGGCGQTPPPQAGTSSPAGDAPLRKPEDEDNFDDQPKTAPAGTATTHHTSSQHRSRHSVIFLPSGRPLRSSPSGQVAPGASARPGSSR